MPTYEVLASAYADYKQALTRAAASVSARSRSQSLSAMKSYSGSMTQLLELIEGLVDCAGRVGAPLASPPSRGRVHRGDSKVLRAAKAYRLASFTGASRGAGSVKVVRTLVLGAVRGTSPTGDQVLTRDHQA